ncbi:hypothetical protein A0H81_03008 [Grifola frondosa]|uniref:Uncharacterized protein n=1 Tax=Grifola frondosa TaxID=5627 RepID=A0A1C7MHD5_GRIFR|nr:hypothetical protein A0H81_03008 [Grifola frondosa]
MASSLNVRYLETSHNIKVSFRSVSLCLPNKHYHNLRPPAHAERGRHLLHDHDHKRRPLHLCAPRGAPGQHGAAPRGRGVDDVRLEDLDGAKLRVHGRLRSTLTRLGTSSAGRTGSWTRSAARWSSCWTPTGWTATAFKCSVQSYRSWTQDVFDEEYKIG